MSHVPLSDLYSNNNICAQEQDEGKEKLCRLWDYNPSDFQTYLVSHLFSLSGRLIIMYFGFGIGLIALF